MCSGSADGPNGPSYRAEPTCVGGVFALYCCRKLLQRRIAMSPQRSSHSHADRTPIAGWTVLIAGLLFLPGCLRPDHAGPGGLDGATVGRISKEDLRGALNMFEDAFDAALSQATTEMEEKSTDPRIRRNTLLWRVRMMPACHSAMRQEDSIRA